MSAGQKDYEMHDAGGASTVGHFHFVYIEGLVGGSPIPVRSQFLAQIPVPVKYFFTIPVRPARLFFATFFGEFGA